MFKTIIPPEHLIANLGRPDWVVVDCRFDLTDPSAGYREYRAGHVPAAVYVHLDRDLSAAPGTGRGRHPLPDAAQLEAVFQRIGVQAETQVVAYDASGGAIASRLWWTLRFLGHGAVAVLDGGWQAWLRHAGPTEQTSAQPAAAGFRAAADFDRVAAVTEIPSVTQLVDAREPVRYRGEHEPIDPVAGHIPGAVNHFWKWNLDDFGRFRAPDALAAMWLKTLGSAPAAATVHYCGSGVTACHNVLAQVHAGFPLPRLYVGSWSEWCGDRSRAIATA